MGPSRIYLGSVTLAAGLVLGAASLAWAAPMQPSDTPWYPFEEVETTGGWQSGPGRVAYSFFDGNLFFGSHLEVPNLHAGPKADASPSLLPVPSGRCKSLDTEPCASSDRVQALFVLPLCTTQRANDCVEALYTRANGLAEEGSFVKEWVGQDSYEFPSIPLTEGATMASGNMPLFRLDSAPHPGGSVYAVSASVDVSLQRMGSAWKATRWELGVQILAATEISVGDNKSCQEVGTRAIDDKSCLETTHVLPDRDLGVRVRTSASFGSWVFGRVAEPRISITQSGGSISLDVEGRPSVVPMLTTVVESANVTTDMYPGTPPAQGAAVTHFTAGQKDSLKRWSAWNRASNSQADTLTRLWVFRSSNAEFAGMTQCIKQGQVAGWISTNSMVYEATPPIFDRGAGALDFQVGGPAQQPGGTSPVSADYELFLRSDVASCLWPNQKVVKVATVSVLDGAGGEEVTSTSVGESDGWVRFVARNVFFPDPVGSRARAASPNPTIRVVVPPSKAVDTFASCVAMAKKYKDGVSSPGAVNTVTVKGKKIVKPALGKPFISGEIYSANRKLDKDTDGLACEREPRVR